MKFLVALASMTILSSLQAQPVVLAGSRFEPIGVGASIQRIDGRDALRVVKNDSITEFDAATFARLADIEDFKDGIIEVKVLSRLLPNAPELARGFIGVTFRVKADNSKFESIYIRPTNGRAEQQLRRNRSIQYFSYPDFKFERLRKDAPGEYESYADMGLNEWITLRIEVSGKRAKLFLNANTQPSIIVNDLKLGESVTGAIGLFVDVGTEGFFTDLKVQKH